MYSTVIQYKADGSPANIPVYNGKADGDIPYYGMTNSFNPPWIYRVYGNTVTSENPDGWVNVRYYFNSSSEASCCVFGLDISGLTNQKGHALWLDEVSITAYDNIANLDFEYADNMNRPVGWFASTARDNALDYRVVSDVYHSGNSSLYIKTDSLNNPQSIISSALIPVNRTGGKRIYEISFYVSSRNSNFKSIQLDLWYYNQDGLKICATNIDTLASSAVGTIKSLNSGSERSERSYVFTRLDIDADAYYVSPVFTLSEGAAEIWLDDITIKQVEDDGTIIVAQNDFHAKDESGNIGRWTVVDDDLNYVTDNALSHNVEVGQGTTTYYGSLTSSDGNDFMRYSTNTIETAYEYRIVLWYRSAKAVQVQLRFLNYMRKEYVGERKSFDLSSSSDWVSEEIIFISPSVTYLDVLVRNLSGGAHDISKIIIYQGDSKKADMSWSASWINYYKDFRWSKENTSFYYRKTIEISGTEIVYAPLQFTADDQVALYVNGIKILSTIGDASSSWSAINIVEIQDYTAFQKVIQNGTDMSEGIK